MTLSETVRALADGQTISAALSMIWGVHDGVRGATWLTVVADGAVTECHWRPGLAIATPLPEKKLGVVDKYTVQGLAAVLTAMQFDRIQAPTSGPAAPTDAQVELIVHAGPDMMTVRVPSQHIDRIPALRAIWHAFADIRRKLPEP